MRCFVKREYFFWVTWYITEECVSKAANVTSLINLHGFLGILPENTNCPRNVFKTTRLSTGHTKIRETFPVKSKLAHEIGKRKATNNKIKLSQN